MAMEEKVIYGIFWFLVVTYPVMVAALCLCPKGPERVELPKGPYVVSTRFYNDAGCVGSVPCEGNWLGEEGPYRKCSIWSDGERTWQSDPKWVYGTWGGAERGGA